MKKFTEIFKVKSIEQMKPDELGDEVPKELKDFLLANDLDLLMRARRSLEMNEETSKIIKKIVEEKWETCPQSIYNILNHVGVLPKDIQESTIMKALKDKDPGYNIGGVIAVQGLSQVVNKPEFVDQLFALIENDKNRLDTPVSSRVMTVFEGRKNLKERIFNVLVGHISHPCISWRESVVDWLIRYLGKECKVDKYKEIFPQNWEHLFKEKESKNDFYWQFGGMGLAYIPNYLELAKFYYIESRCKEIWPKKGDVEGRTMMLKLTDFKEIKSLLCKVLGGGREDSIPDHDVRRLISSDGEKDGSFSVGNLYGLVRRIYFSSGGKVII